MNEIIVTTPENIEITYCLAGPLSRTAAAVIDFLIISIAVTIVSVIAFYSFIGNVPFERLMDRLISFNFSGIISAVYLIIVFAIIFGYFIINEMVFKGQSIGKKILGLRVIRENGRPISLAQSVIRNLIRFFIDNIGIGIALMFFSKRLKRVGDMAAGTIVVSENSRKIEIDSLITDATQEVAAADPGKYKLSQQEVYLIKEYFSRKDSFLDGGVHVKARIDKYMAKKFEIDESKISEEALQKLLVLNS